jgi:hypothetical protein
MAAKKYATSEIKDSKGKVSKVRGIDASTETVEVTDDAKKVTLKNVGEAVFDYVTASSQEKAFKEKKEEAAGILRTFIGGVRKFFSGKETEPTKTYRVLGKEVGGLTYAVDVSSSDKVTFSDKKEDIMKFKKEITAGVFKQLLKEESVISIKKIVSDDDKKRKEFTALLLEKLGEDMVKEYFERSVTYVPTPDMFSKIRSLSKEGQKIVWDFFKAPSDAVKDATDSTAA